jgi:chemotaxis protein CheD
MSSVNTASPKLDFRIPVSPFAATQDSRAKVFLHSGQFHVALPSVSTAITCMLGSCVAVCLWDSKLRTGGAVHYLLPGEAGTSTRNAGVQGITDLVSSMEKLGAKTHYMAAKIFGGACMLKELRGAHVGDRNVEVARVMLKELGIRVLQEDVGGERVRRIRFLADTGQTTVELV